MTTSSFSIISSKTENDTIVSITSTQLKEINLIFAEHYKFLNENKLLKSQIRNYKMDNNLLLQTDSVRKLQLATYKDYNNSLQNSLKKKNKTLLYWKIGGITICSSLLLLFLFKK